MSKAFTRLCAGILAALMLLLCACSSGGCTSAKTNSKSSYPSPSVSYNSAFDEPFLPKDIFDSSMYTNGLVPFKKSNTEYYVEVKGESDASKAFVLKGEYGKCYEIKCPKGMSGLRAAVVYSNPKTADVGSKIESDKALLYYGTQPSADIEPSFMYVARDIGTYLVVYTGRDAPTLQVLERTMLQTTDISDHWFTPPQIGGIKGINGAVGGSYANYKWTSDEVYDNLYETFRKKYPDYISREYMGKDQSGKYDMYGYIYEPEQYKTCMFLTAGMHGGEQVGWFALAAFLGLVCDATPDGDPLLWFLRNHVKFIVVPMINVWSVSETQRRYNSENVDLNRDWKSLTQQENINTYEFFKKYKDSFDVAIDFHNAIGKDISMYYNFINFTPNAAANYKTTNHMYHRLHEIGHITATPDITHIPGSYVKNSMFIEGRIWNEFKVPSMTVEHANYPVNSPLWGGRSEMTLAVEIYGNFIIQNALFFSQDK